MPHARLLCCTFYSFSTGTHDTKKGTLYLTWSHAGKATRWSTGHFTFRSLLLVNALVELNQDLPTVTNITLPDDHSASTSTKSSSLTSRDGATPIKGMPETQQRERTKRTTGTSEWQTRGSNKQDFSIGGMIVCPQGIQTLINRVNYDVVIVFIGRPHTWTRKGDKHYHKTLNLRHWRSFPVSILATRVRWTKGS